MRCKSILTALLLALTVPVAAQFTSQPAIGNIFNHMDLGINVGSPGIGLDVAFPVTDWARVRTGFYWMPSFQLRSAFGVEFDKGPEDDTDAYNDRIRRMKDLMHNLSGYEVKDNIDMVLQPTAVNFKFLVDLMPIPNNRHWNLTFGFFAGARRIGKADNANEESPTLLAVGMYNSFYRKACMGEPLISYEDGSGNMHSADLPSSFADRFMEAGMMGMPLGYFKDGDPETGKAPSRAMMVPDKNGMACAEMTVNPVRPYIGLGYTTTLSHDGRFRLAADAGVLLWGGTPHVWVDNVYKVNDDNDNALVEWVVPEGGSMWEGEWHDCPSYRIDLTRDVENIGGKVGRWVDVAKKFKCFPVLSITFSYRLF